MSETLATQSGIGGKPQIQLPNLVMRNTRQLVLTSVNAAPEIQTSQILFNQTFNQQSFNQFKRPLGFKTTINTCENSPVRIIKKAVTPNNINYQSNPTPLSPTQINQKKLNRNYNKVQSKATSTVLEANIHIQEPFRKHFYKSSTPDRNSMILKNLDIRRQYAEQI
jgi:hypothetical protein